MDETFEYNSGWDIEKTVKQIITGIMINPHGYDKVEDFSILLDGGTTKIKLEKKGEKHEVNIRTRKEYRGDKAHYIAEIWPLESLELEKKKEKINIKLSKGKDWRKAVAELRKEKNGGKI